MRDDSSLELHDRMVNSVAWLDVTAPGWRQRIDVATLDMACPDNCVLGQLHLWGAYMDSVFCEDDDAYPTHAFDTPDEVIDYSYKDLQDAWEAELARPRGLPCVPDPT